MSTLLAPTAASAAFPGANGPVVFHRAAGVRADERTSQIFAVTPDGSTRQLTRLTGGSLRPSVSPDGRRIVFERGRSRRVGPAREIWTMNADGTGTRRLTTGCTGRCLGEGGPSFSPDGSKVLFVRVYGPLRRRGNRFESYDQPARVDLLVVGSGGGAATRVKRYGRDPQPRNSAPRWSPDGRSIVVALGTFRRPTKHSLLGGAVHVLDSGGIRQRRLTPWSLGAGFPDWSPDGARIVFNSEGGHSPSIHVVNADGSGLRRVVPAGRQFGMEPVWSPDGTKIAFSWGDVLDRARRIYVAGADGSDPRPLTSDRRTEGAPSWAVAG